MKLGKFYFSFSYSLDHKDRRITNCFVSKDNETISFGQAICSPNDNFWKDKGRKIAIKDALTYLPISKQERKNVWEDYRNSKPVPRW